MNKSLPFFIFLSIHSFLTTAQITVTSATFPEVGDTLRARNVLTPDVMPGPAEQDVFWDFSSLSAPIGIPRVVLPPEEGSMGNAFPEADLLITTGPGLESYYRSTDQELTLIGYSGPDPVNLGLNLAYRYQDPQVERFAPLNYGGNNQDESELRVPIAWDDLPSFLIDSLDLSNFPVLPDSLAMNLMIETNDEVDAWGNLQLSGQAYEVLRIKRVRIQNIRIEAQIFGVWLDVTDLVQIPLFQQFQQDTTVSYQFYSATEKEPIVTLIMADDLQSVAQATFLSSGTVANTTAPHSITAKRRPDIQVYPNPVIHQARFQFRGLQAGRHYTLRVLNLLGTTVWEKRMIQSHQLNYTADLSDLPPGTYLYALQEENGRLLKAKRLVVVKP